MLSKGFIALASVVIIAAMLLVVVVAGSVSGFYERGVALESELKMQSRLNARSCINYAASALLSAEYKGGAYSLGSSGSCEVRNIDITADTANFVAEGVSGRAITILRVVYDLHNRDVVEEEEIPN